MYKYHFLLFVFLGIMVVGVAKAQEVPQEKPAMQSALGVSPAILEAVLDEEPLKNQIVVFNVTNVPLPIKGYARNFVSSEEVSEEMKKVFDASAWLKLEPTDFILQPNKEQTVEVEITPPENAEPGGHYATIYFQPLIPEEVLSKGNSIISSRIGVLAFLLVKGDMIEKASLENLYFDEFSQYGPSVISYAVKNEGNVHIVPAGGFKIIGIFGREMRIDLKNNVVLPGTSRNFEIQTAQKLFLPGRYKLITNINYGVEQKSLANKEYIFWVFPFIPITVSTILLTTIYWILIIRRSRVKVALKILFKKK